MKHEWKTWLSNVRFVVLVFINEHHVSWHVNELVQLYIIWCIDACQKVHVAAETVLKDLA